MSLPPQPPDTTAWKPKTSLSKAVRNRQWTDGGRPGEVSDDNRKYFLEKGTEQKEKLDKKFDFIEANLEERVKEFSSFKRIKNVHFNYPEPDLFGEKPDHTFHAGISIDILQDDRSLLSFQLLDAHLYNPPLAIKEKTLALGEDNGFRALQISCLIVLRELIKRVEMDVRSRVAGEDYLAIPISEIVSFRYENDAWTLVYLHTDPVIKYEEFVGQFGV